MKKVEIGLRLTSEFVSRLRTNLTLENTMHKTRQLTPKEALAIAVLGEGMGSYIEETYEKMTDDWVGEEGIEIISDRRRVIEE